MNKILKASAIILGIGVSLGIFTSFGQTYIHGPFNQLTNSYSIWLILSFLGGMLLKNNRNSLVLIAGAMVQYIAILFYYIASSVRFDMSLSTQEVVSANIIWLVGGTLVGPVAALAGAIVGRNSKYTSLAVSFMAALFTSESLYLFINLKYSAEGILFLVVTALFLATIYYKIRFNILITLLLTLIFSCIMYVGYAYVLGGLFG